jgi:hypothetical protein
MALEEVKGLEWQRAVAVQTGRRGTEDCRGKEGRRGYIGMQRGQMAVEDTACRR